MIDTGDYVKHNPTGEQWIVAYVQGNRLAFRPATPGKAKLADCEDISIRVGVDCKCDGFDDLEVDISTRIKKRQAHHLALLDCGYF